MALTNAGRDFIADAIIDNGTPTLFTNANAYLGVGDSTAVFDATQTDLQGAVFNTNKFRQGMEATYPQKGASNEIVLRSLFATGTANIAWEEWGVFNDGTDGGGVMLSRLVESLGTKTSAQSWQLTVTLTVVAA